MIMDNCVSPPELDDRQLLLYLDGERNADLLAHLERCPYCRERSLKLAHLQNNLTAQMYRITCPTSIELGDYVLGLSPADRSAIDRRALANLSLLYSGGFTAKGLPEGIVACA